MAEAGERYLVIKGGAGLGNRILCTLSGILYGILSKRTIIVDWRDGLYGDPGDNAFQKIFDCSVVKDISSLPDTQDIDRPI
jgi:hypothetical protein